MEKILIAGGTGLIGKKITEMLDKERYIIHILSRSPRTDRDNIRYFQWNLDEQHIDEEALQVDHIINLAGAGIADKRWSDDRKKQLISSRVLSAQLIQHGLEKAGLRPKSYISASAIGFYGDSGDQKMLEEDAPVDDGFLSKCTMQWEQAAKKLKPLVERCLIFRVGIVLSRQGGAFQKMLMPFKAGLASYFGKGDMHYSWIHIEDMARIFIHGIQRENMHGIYNAVAPNVATNKEIIQSIKQHRTGFSILNSVPRLALRLAMGEMADVVLTSNKVSVEKLLSTGYTFKFPQIDLATQHLLQDH